MSELKVNKVSPRSGTDVTLGDSGDTFTIPAGATITNSGTANGFGVALANDGDNRVVTATGAGGLNGEANLTFDGTNLDLGDDKKIRLGASQDLEIYHDGSGGSYIKDTGNGVLFMQTNGLRLRSTADESMLDADENSGVSLYFDNSKKNRNYH